MVRARSSLLMWVALILLAVPQAAFAASQMQDLENALMCKCDDKCGKVLINCTCDTSKETRKTLKAKLESGLTVEQIIQQYVDQYGETVLSAPTKNGFNLSAWIMPFVALIAGGLGVRKAIQSWTKPEQPGTGAPEKGEESPTEEPAVGKYSKKLQDELDRLES